MTDDRDKQRKAHHAEQARLVRIKHMLYIHQTDKGGVLLEESPELSGEGERRQVWLPRSRIFNPSRPLAGCYPRCPLEFEVTKALADEKELFYE